MSLMDKAKIYFGTMLMLKKTLLVFVVLLATVSTSLYANRAMKEIIEYREYLEKALIQGDWENVKNYAVALTGLVLDGEIEWKGEAKQKYGATILGTRVMD